MKALASLASVVLFAGLASANINVSGTGKVTYVPDVGYVSVGVFGEGGTAQEAWEKNRAAVERIFAALQKLGIDAKDVQTTNLNVSPKYQYPKDQPPVLIGYTVSYDLQVTVRKLDQMGRVLDSLVEGGANRNMGIRFGCSDPERLLDEARAKAVADARKKANLYATGAGAALGQVLEIRENADVPTRGFRFEYAAPMADKGLPIAVGQQEMTVTVYLTFAINHRALS